MTQPWAAGQALEPPGTAEITVIEGTSFCISDAVGEVAAGVISGLFVRDTRFLSRWELSVGDCTPHSLSVHHAAPFSAIFVGRVADASDGRDLVVVRRRHLGEGLREDLSVCNATGARSSVDVMLEVAADFADLFEAKEGRAPTVDETHLVIDGPDGVEIRGHRGGVPYGVVVEAEPPAQVVGSCLRWAVDLGPHETWQVRLTATPSIGGRRLRPLHPIDLAPEYAEPSRRRREWTTRTPQIATADRVLADTVQRGVDDLGTLRIFDPERPDLPMVAAGAPWFMALFGRDSLLTSLMTMPIDTSLAIGTLTALAAHQGVRRDPITEEQPGRILHERRFGPSGTLALGGGSTYYGSVDATPLFVVLLGELHRWHPEAVTPDLVAAADRALAWMLEDGDVDGDGFIEYARLNDAGLVNQGWKDSWDGVNHADGRVAVAPIALAEVQGYAYAAYRARAAIARAGGDTATAASWSERATTLKAAFDERFWLPDRGWYAVGIDADGRPIDALTSNIGHCLWTGIVTDEHAAAVAGHLVGESMFTGWGIRTLAADMGAFNPMSYHNGSVWPHDTAICVAGLARYGFMEEAGRVGLGLLDAADLLGGHLPELFAGFARSDIAVPVRYPAACSPQAWATAAPLHVLRALLRLEPGGVGEPGVRCDPVLPSRLLPFSMSDLVVRGRASTVIVDADGARVVATVTAVGGS